MEVSSPIPIGDGAPVTRAEQVSVADLFAAHRLGLVRLAVLLVDDLATAEDIVQDAFSGLHARRRDLRDPNRALGYLRTAVVNNARSALRRRRTARAHIPPHVAPSASPETQLLLAEEHREMLTALRRLSPRQREVVVLRYWSDLSVREVSEALRISTGTVKSTTSKALAALAQQLKEAP